MRQERGRRRFSRHRRLGWAAAALGALCCLAAAGAAAEVTQVGNLRLAVQGRILPHLLPRSEPVPVSIAVSGRISSTDGRSPPALSSVRLEINGNGRLDLRGLPICRYNRIRAATTKQALRACPGAVVGHGRLEAKIVLPEQAPFPSNGRIVAFNGRLRGRPVLLAHVYGSQPVPQTQVLAFRLRRAGTVYRTELATRIPRAGTQWGYVSGISLTLHRRFRFHGRLHSYVSAGCPAPPGFPGTTFRLARISFAFEDGRTLASTLTRSCRVRR